MNACCPITGWGFDWIEPLEGEAEEVEELPKALPGEVGPDFEVVEEGE